MTPSASAPTCLACSGVLIPNLKLWIEYQGDMDVAEVETTHILAYLNYLRTDYVPHCITGNNDKKLSPKTVYNLYFSVASFFTWALCRR